MFQSRKVLIIVPARGGSKGVKLKNIHPLMGIPLIAHAGALIRGLGYVDKSVVSTDHLAIAEVARESGLEAPFMRPEELSGDHISDFQVLHHALSEMERLDGTRYDVVVMLQPTSPLRKPAHVTAVIAKLVEEDWDAVWTVSPTDLKYHPLKQLTLGGDGSMEYYDSHGGAIIARQQLDPIFHRNGAAYGYTRECLLEQRTVKGKRTAGLVLDEPMISIDTLADFDRVEQVLRQRAKKGTSST